MRCHHSSSSIPPVQDSPETPGTTLALLRICSRVALVREWLLVRAILLQSASCGEFFDVVVFCLSHHAPIMQSFKWGCSSQIRHCPQDLPGCPPSWIAHMCCRTRLSSRQSLLISRGLAPQDCKCRHPPGWMRWDLTSLLKMMHKKQNLRQAASEVCNALQKGRHLPDITCFTRVSTSTVLSLRWRRRFRTGKDEHKTRCWAPGFKRSS